jgi:hypothetical protein
MKLSAMTLGFVGGMQIIQELGKALNNTDVGGLLVLCELC